MAELATPIMALSRGQTNVTRDARRRAKTQRRGFQRELWTLCSGQTSVTEL